MTKDDDWADRSLEDLVEHLLHDHHRPLRIEPLRFAAMARRVHAEDGLRDPRLATLVQAVEALARRLPRIARLEAEGVFPWILAGRAAFAAGPAQAARRDRERAAAALERIADLTDGLCPPADASATRRALYRGLAALAERLREHHRLEDDVLLPRALGGEAYDSKR